MTENQNGCPHYGSEDILFVGQSGKPGVFSCSCRNCGETFEKVVARIHSAPSFTPEAVGRPTQS